MASSPTHELGPPCHAALESSPDQLVPCDHAHHNARSEQRTAGGEHSRDSASYRWQPPDFFPFVGEAQHRRVRMHQNQCSSSRLVSWQAMVPLPFPPGNCPRLDLRVRLGQTAPSTLRLPRRCRVGGTPDE
eukprot:scaffold2631_cov412-Prasinococcus_capsulatus_cf.AAC.25